MTCYEGILVGIPLPNRRKQVDRPLIPRLVGSYVDVLHTQLRKLAYVRLVSRPKLCSYVHHGPPLVIA